jgi:hypothetical protein
MEATSSPILEPEPDTRLPCKDVPLYFSSVPIKFVERLAGADPKPARSVLTRGLDSVIPEARRVSRVGKSAWSYP